MHLISSLDAAYLFSGLLAVKEYAHQLKAGYIQLGCRTTQLHIKTAADELLANAERIMNEQFGDYDLAEMPPLLQHIVHE